MDSGRATSSANNEKQMQRLLTALTLVSVVFILFIPAMRIFPKAESSQAMAGCSNDIGLLKEYSESYRVADINTIQSLHSRTHR